MRKFERRRHVRYFAAYLRNLPRQYSSADTTRLSLVHFCLQALDILGCLPGDGPETCGEVGSGDVYIDRGPIVEWIYSLQTLPVRSVDEASERIRGGGFKGGTYLGPIDDGDGGNGASHPRHPYDHSHLAMTYVAICSLRALGDDLSRVDAEAVLGTIRSLQREDGSFDAVSATADGGSDLEEGEARDLRFMYTAIATWYLLTRAGCSGGPATKEIDAEGDDRTIRTINIEAATEYIISCMAYDGSLALTPHGREGHGGSTLCGVASLRLMGVLDEVAHRLDGWKCDLVYWCVSRQYPLPSDRRDRGGEGKSAFEYDGYAGAGMQGRPNKLEDTCYSYWIGGTLHLLGESRLLNGQALREYVLSCQSPYGGFGKTVGAMPDLLHSYYSLAWLSLSNEGGCCDDESYAPGEDDAETIESIGRLRELDCALGIAKR